MLGHATIGIHWINSSSGRKRNNWFTNMVVDSETNYADNVIDVNMI